jgi:heme/copper-type cytochrome/quinol oxidase subunit 4
MNYYVLLIFAPILILVGILGFVIPDKKSLTSGAPAYNIFHIIFGITGLIIVLFGPAQYIRAFNIVFGAIDLYQAAASFLHIFPEKQFRWKRADDVLHIVIGAALVLVGLVG